MKNVKECKQMLLDIKQLTDLQNNKTRTCVLCELEFEPVHDCRPHPADYIVPFIFVATLDDQRDKYVGTDNIDYQTYLSFINLKTYEFKEKVSRIKNILKIMKS